MNKETKLNKLTNIPFIVCVFDRLDAPEAWSSPRTHTHTHTRAQTHTRTHTRTLTHTHSHTHTHARANTHTHTPGAGKVFYVGGAVWGGGSQFLHINITPNRNRKSCYSLTHFHEIVLDNN